MGQMGQTKKNYKGGSRRNNGGYSTPDARQNGKIYLSAQLRT